MIIPHWPIYTGPNKDMNTSIKRTKTILARLGNPHNNMKNIIHITGTKGKGSTALYISNILHSSGYKVNTYTSPHIFECNERILLNGTIVDDEKLFEATEIVRFACEEQQKEIINPSMFEAMTCSAFYLMANNNADFNVIEVGMGAINDATNVFDDNIPIACVFTPIHLDHTKFLGNTIEEVAVKKSFLIKEKTQNVILSSQAKEVKNVIKNIAKKLSVKNIFTYGEEYEVFTQQDDIDEGIFLKKGQPIYENKKLDTCFPFEKPNMEGDYQLINCGCAITTCLMLKANNIANNITIDTINNGISKTTNIVRMQKIENEKILNLLPKGSIFYVDGAHNQLAAHALANWILNFKKSHNNFKIIVAVARTKGVDNTSFLKEFLYNNTPIIDLLIATRANLESIPEPPEKIAEATKKLNIPCKIAYSTKEIIQFASNYDTNTKILLICTGSLYIARDIKHFITCLYYY